MSLGRSSGRPFGTFVVPVYNAAPLLAGTLATVHAWLSRRPEAWELVIVDDGSDDGSGEVVDRFVAERPDDAIARMRFAENRGKGLSVRTGLGVARGRVVLFTDCDLAYPIDNAVRILDALEKGADVAIACRVLDDSCYIVRPSFFHYFYTRHLMGRGFNLLCRVLTVPRILDTQAGLKGFRIEAVRPILPRLVLDGFSFDVELLRALLDRGARIAEVPVSFRYDSEPSTVHFALDSTRMIRDLVRVRLRSMRGVYRSATEAAPTRLVVHADDYGLAPGVNRAIEEGFESGAITSASILLAGGDVRSALAWAASHPGFDYGVHLNLTHGSPELPPERVPSLVDANGRFRSRRALLARLATGRVRLEEVAAEWSAQIAAIRAAGVPVSHLDSHHHVHLFPPLFRSVAAPLAREHRLDLRAMTGPAGFLGTTLDLKGILFGALSRLAFSRSERTVRARGTGTSLMASPTLGVFRRLLRRMNPAETYELVVHPGYVDEALRRSGDPYVDARERERRLVSSAELRGLLSIRGVELLARRHREGA